MAGLRSKSPTPSPSSSVPDVEVRQVHVRTGSGSYRALVAPGGIERLAEWLDGVGLRGRLRIVADRQVWETYGESVEEHLRTACRELAVSRVAGGEEQKTLATAERLYDWLIEAGTDRGDCLVAVGGGVVGDLAGFVAATYLRGIALVHVPTTLLAQVDSSIGGKVAVNHRLGKNLIGAFHQPSLVVADTRVLSSLPEREYRAGWAEIVKVAMVGDEELFRTLQAHADTLLAVSRLPEPPSEEEKVLADVICRAIELKADVVAEDEREEGRRVILNYGHTIGHALEAATGYQRYLHGEAVAIGMAGAGFIASQRGLIRDDELQAQADLLARFGLPSSAEGVEAHSLLAPLSRDKKARGATIQWVLPAGIGRVTTARDIDEREVDAALRAVGCR